MSEPRFQIGDRVAVCSSGLEVVLPSTTVRDLRRRPAQLNRNPITREIHPLPERWAYLVEGCEYFICEWCLRPIGPDEYSDPLITSREVSA